MAIFSTPMYKNNQALFLQYMSEFNEHFFVCLKHTCSCAFSLDAIKGKNILSSNPFDPLSFATSILSNLATDILKHHSNQLGDTVVGKFIKSAGIADKTFSDRLEATTQQAIDHLILTKPKYDLVGIGMYLSDAYVAKMIVNHILNRQAIEDDEKRKHLEKLLKQHMGATISKLHHRGIEPVTVVHDFLKSYQIVLKEYLDEASLLILYHLMKQEESILSAIIASEKRLKDYTSTILSQANSKQDSIRETYLNALLRQKEEESWDQKYVPLSAMPEILLKPEQSMSKGFIPQSFQVVLANRSNPEDEQPTHFDSIEDAVDEYRHLLLLGQPGSGKTTVLQKLLYDAASRAHNDPNEPVPFLIYLGKDFLNSTYEIDDLIDRICVTHRFNNLHPSQMLILLDGANQLHEEHRVTLIDTLLTWLGIHKSTRLIISGRIGYDYSTLYSKLSVIRVEELSNVQIKSFLAKNIGTNNVESVIDQLKISPNLSDDRSLIRLATNPYFLSIITYLFSSENYDIPTSQGTLFNLYVEALLEREQFGDDFRAALMLAFGEVAVAMLQLGSASRKMDTNWARKQLPDDLKSADEDIWIAGREMGILELTHNEDFSFLGFKHELLAEYFASTNLSDSYPKLVNIIGTPHFIDGYRMETPWDNVLRMMVSNITSEDLFSSLMIVDPILAADLLEDIVINYSIDQEIVSKVIEELVSLFLEDEITREVSIKTLANLHYHEEVKDKMSEILDKGLSIEKRAAIKVLSQLHIDVDYNISLLISSLSDRNNWVRRDAEQALIDYKEQASSALQDVIQNTSDSELKKQVLEILIVNPIQENTKILKDALHQGDHEVGRFLHQYLESRHSDLAGASFEHTWMIKELAKGLLSSTKKEWKTSALKTLGLTGSKRDLGKLKSLIEDEDPMIVYYTIKQLDNVKGKWVINKLQEILRSDRYEQFVLPESPRAAAARVLGLNRDVTSIPLLRWAAYSSNTFVRSEAIVALGRFRDPHNFDLFVDILMNAGNVYLQSNAAMALGLLGDPRAISILRTYANDPKERIRSSAIKGLALIDDPSVTNYIIDGLFDKNKYVRQEAACALAIIRDPDTCKYLEEALQDYDHYVRQWATLSLGVIGTSHSLEPLKKALNDDIQFVRHKAVAAISIIRDESTIPTLINCLQDEDKFIRQQAILGLSRLHAVVGINDILMLKADNNMHVRAALARALADLEYADKPSVLIPLLLADNERLVRQNAAHALGKLGIKQSDVIDALLDATSDESDFVRKYAVIALRKLGIISTLERIVEISKSDTSEFVRREARDAAKKDVFKNVDPKTNDSSIKIVSEPVESGTNTSSESKSPTAPKIEAHTPIRTKLHQTERTKRMLEEGRINDLVDQAILDPREDRRLHANAVLTKANLSQTNDIEEVATTICDKLNIRDDDASDKVLEIVISTGALFTLEILKRVTQIEVSKSPDTEKSKYDSDAKIDIFLRLVKDRLDPISRSKIFKDK